MLSLPGEHYGTSLYVTEQGAVAEYAPTGDWIEGYYPGYPGYADPVDEPEYAEFPRERARLDEAVGPPRRYDGVTFGPASTPQHGRRK